VPESHPVLAAVEALDVDRLTPLDALHFVAQLKGILKARA
jgi:hypothetical protein